MDQERLERVETAQWRQLLFALCFLHSVVRGVALSTFSVDDGIVHPHFSDGTGLV